MSGHTHQMHMMEHALAVLNSVICMYLLCQLLSQSLLYDSDLCSMYFLFLLMLTTNCLNHCRIWQTRGILTSPWSEEWYLLNYVRQQRKYGRRAPHSILRTSLRSWMAHSPRLPRPSVPQCDVFLHQNRSRHIHQLHTCQVRECVL